MKYVIIAAAVLLLATSAQAQYPRPPVPLGTTIDAVDGVGLIGWENSVQADTIIAVINRADCMVPAITQLADPSDPQMSIQVPAGPPYDERCRLRPGDRVSLARYRDGVYVDTIGPWVVPVYVWLPMVRGE